MTTLRSLFARVAPAKASAVIHLPDGTRDTVQPRPLRKRLAVLFAVIAVPAMAAPGEFGALPGDAPSEAEIVNKRLARQLAQNPAMDFERPGMSFPGSAFYFLADPPANAMIALPTTDALSNGKGEAGRELGEMIDTGPAAQPFFSAGGINAMRAQECLAQAIWYEAASEREAGQRAVAQVVLNRVAHPNWPASVCGVVYQGSERRTGCQFTFTCDGSLARRAGGASWNRAQRIASEALSGSVYEPIGHATHYHTLWVNPYWASSLDHVGTVGAHRFYKNRGAAGEQRAFTSRYSGKEPSVTGRVTNSAAASRGRTRDVTGAGGSSPAPSNPAAYSATPTGQSMAGTGSAARADLADPSYSAVGQVREPYANAGQWKSEASRAAREADERALAEKAAEPQAKPATKPGS